MWRELKGWERIIYTLVMCVACAAYAIELATGNRLFEALGTMLLLLTVSAFAWQRRQLWSEQGKAEQRKADRRTHDDS